MPALRQRQPHQADPGFLAFVRRQRCCACGAPPPVQAAHVRMACLERGKRATGIGEKPDDRWAVGLCRGCHLDGPGAQHRVGEERFWRLLKLDPVAIAERLYAEYRPALQIAGASSGPLAVGEVLTFPPGAKAVSRKRRSKTSVFRVDKPKPKRPTFRQVTKQIAARFGMRLDGSKPKRKWPSRPFNRRKP